MNSFIKKIGVFSLILLFFCFTFLGATAQADSLSAPEIIAVDEGEIKSKPAIKGSADNDAFVHIYIDGAYNGKTITFAGNPDGINFAYTPYLGLASGEHRVWAIAENVDGEKSGLSNIFKFSVEKEEEKKQAAEPSVPAAPSAPTADKNISDDGIENANQKNAENGLEENLGDNSKIENKEGEDGKENGEDKNEDKLSAGVIIFIIFLAGIIGWIIWVNRELVKEKMDKKSGGNNTPLDKK